MTESKCEPEQLKGRIIFMSMFNDIDWRKRGNKEDCITNALRVTEYARRFTRGHWSFPGPGSEKKWYGTHVNKPDVEWEKTAGGMRLNFAESGHPVLRATSALERGELKSNGQEVNSTHFKGSDDTIELIFLTIFRHAAQCLRSSSGFVWRIEQKLTRYAANENLESMVIPTEFPTSNPFFGLMTKYKETCCVNASRNSPNFVNN